VFPHAVLSALQVFALHPLYFSLDALSNSASLEVQQEIQTARQELDLPVSVQMGLEAVLCQGQESQLRLRPFYTELSFSTTSVFLAVEPSCHNGFKISPAALPTCWSDIASRANQGLLTSWARACPSRHLLMVCGLQDVDYDGTMAAKLRIARKVFESEGDVLLQVWICRH